MADPGFMMVAPAPMRRPVGPQLPKRRVRADLMLAACHPPADFFQEIDRLVLVPVLETRSWIMAIVRKKPDYAFARTYLADLENGLI